MGRRSPSAPDETADRTHTALVPKPARRGAAPEPERLETAFADALTSPGAMTSAQEPAMTRYASRSMMVAETVQGDLARKRYGPRPGWQLKVAEPYGPSTDGGLKARQALLLVPSRGDGVTFQCGWLDAAKMCAQLRSWEAMYRRHLARFGVEPELGQEGYGQFLEDCRRSLTSCELEVQLVVPDDEPPARPARTPPKTGTAGRTMLVAVIAFALGLAVGLLARL